jgi:serine/threonine protein kinase
MGIVHGDLKHSNMLFRWKDSAKNPNNVEICVCDFGFSGTVNGEQYYPLIGFMRHYGCNPKRTIHYGSATKSRKNIYAGGILQPRFKLQSPIPPTLLTVMNRCQLYIALAEQTRLYLWNQKQFMRMPPHELLKMMNLDSPEIVEAFKAYCPRVRTLPHRTYFSKLFFPLEKTRYEFGSGATGTGGDVETGIGIATTKRKVKTKEKGTKPKPPAQQDKTVKKHVCR